MAIDWQQIRSELSAHFAPATVQWRLQGTGKPGAKVLLVPYLDVRHIAARLDHVCPGWSFDWIPVSTNSKGEVIAAKGTLTIAGCSRSDVGTGSTGDVSKGAIADALKRCAALFGVAAYLYSLPDVYITLNAEGQVAALTLTRLAESLGALTKMSEGTNGQSTMSSVLDISDVSTSLLPPPNDRTSA